MLIVREAWHSEAREAFLSTEDILGRSSRRNSQARRAHNILLELEEAINSAHTKHGPGLDEFQTNRSSQKKRHGPVGSDGVDAEDLREITTTEIILLATNVRESSADLGTCSLKEVNVHSGGRWEPTPQLSFTGSETSQILGF